MGVPAKHLRYGVLVNRERSVSEFVPYSCHLDPHTIALRSGACLQVLHIPGLDFETQDQLDLNRLKEVRNTLWRTLADPRFAVVHTCIRREIPPVSPERFENSFCDALEHAWTERLSQYRAFVVDHYLTILRRDLSGTLGVLESLRKGFAKVDPATRDAARSEHIRVLDEASATVLKTLARYGARRLGVTETTHGPQSEVLRFLAYLLNHQDRLIALPQMDLATYLPGARVSFGRDAVEIRGATHDSVRVGALLSIKEYPSRTFPGILDALLRCPHEFVLTQTFAFIDRQAALKALALQGRRMDTAEDAAVSLRAHLEEARDDAASGRSAFGEHHLTVLVKTSSVRELDDAVSDLNAEFLALGIVPVRESLNLEPAYWAQLPGNFPYIARRALISSANFAGFASFHTFPSGQAVGNHWGRCVTTLETTSGTPYSLNFHHNDLGHARLEGPSGSGKTVLLLFLIAQAQRFRPRTVYFDKDRGAEIAIRAMGGAYSEIRPGRFGLGNPFLLPDTPTNRAFLAEFLATLLSPNRERVLSPMDRRVIVDAVAASYAQPAEFRQLSYIQELFRGHERSSVDSLAARLAPWHGAGEYAWLFDNKEDDLQFDQSMTGFDMTFILDLPAMRTPALLYLFHRVDLLLDGQRTIVVIDEAWKALQDPVFEPRINDWLKTGRKRNLVVIFAAQSAQDVLTSPIAHTLIEQTPTQIFFPNYRAEVKSYREGFRLSAREFELIRDVLDDTSRCFLLKHGHHSVVARLDLSGMDDLLAVLSGRAETLAVLDAVRAEVGDDPSDWLPVFHQRRKRL